jgi:hypothetical protein
MASDTGAPWNLPYPEDSDFVRDGALDIEALAVATASGLSAASRLVAVKHALFTGTQTNSTAAGANFAVTNLSITHTLSDSANALIISAHLGVVSDAAQASRVGMAVADGGSLIGLGDSAGSRARVSAGGRAQGQTAGDNVGSLAFTFVYLPGDTNAHTYTVRAINVRTATQAININRADADVDNQGHPRGASSLVIQEVAA